MLGPRNSDHWRGATRVCLCRGLSGKEEEQREAKKEEKRNYNTTLDPTIYSRFAGDVAEDRESEKGAAGKERERGRGRGVIQGTARLCRAHHDDLDARPTVSGWRAQGGEGMKR